MKIIRENKEYKLTEKELWEAYIEQKHCYNVQIIQDRMYDFLSEEECNALQENQKLIDLLADELENYRSDEVSRAILQEVFLFVKDNNTLQQEEDKDYE